MTTEEDKKYAQSNSPHALIATYLRGEGMITGRAPRLLKQLPKLQEEQRGILCKEMASTVMHIHKKDLHTNTIYDPLTKRDSDFNSPIPPFPYKDEIIWTLTPRGAVGELIDRMKGIFVQQTLLPKNKRYWQRSGLQGIFLDTINVEKTSDQEQYVVTPFFDQALLKAKTKDTITYVRANSSNTAYLAFRELTVYVAKEPYSNPKRVSKVVFDGRAGKYEFDLLCRTDPAKYIVYSCSAFDQWQIETAIMDMPQDKSSPLYHT